MSAAYKVLWSDSAAGDLERIAEYISRDSPRNALRVFSNIREKASRLSTLPERGRIVPELKAHGIHQYRELIVPPWRVVYRIAGKNVYVLSVLDARLNIEDILLQKLAGFE